MHMARLTLVTLTVAVAWHYALPAVAIGTWLFLAAGRMLVSRLPFLPNKDLVFATVAIAVIGSGDALTELMALIAALTLLTHIALIAGFGIQ
jgi:hypothetical protein